MENRIVSNFKLVSEKKLDDIDSTIYEYEHIKTKAKVVHIANDDDNCSFAIGFKTIPEDDSGICHIIEHSVLCGSQRFPLKEPFVNLLKSSVNTFLNAFTASDWTAYPFASQTPKDFDNILKIYLDAVFNPLSVFDNKPFLQEGWHLELNDINDTPSYKGVVYNEMKGAMSSVDELLNLAACKVLYKDNNYRFNSGGDPNAIVNLTYEQYVDFYKRHYHPTNSVAVFYGKLNIEDKLAFMDEQYYSKYDFLNEKIIIKKQEPTICEDYEEDYEIGAEEDIKDNTYMALSYVLCEIKDHQTFLAFAILMEALLSNNDSPIKKALLDANLAQNIECVLDDDNYQPNIKIFLQKTNKDKKEQFKKVFLDVVAKLVKEGIDKELLLATINHLEFKDKECDMGWAPKGLIYSMNVIGSFVFDMPFEASLEYSKYYQQFKELLKTDYFEKLLDKYILNSNHYSLVVLNPSKTLGKQRQKEMDNKMELLKETLSMKEKQELVKQTKLLLEYQNHVDTKKELDTLPKLQVKDISTNIKDLKSLKCKVNGMNCIYHPIKTNKIAYLKMYFDASSLKFDDLIYLTLLKSLLLNVKTSKYDVTTLQKLIKINLGDLGFSYMIQAIDKDNAKVMFKVNASAVNENVDKMPDILNQVLLHSKFSKKETLTIIKQLANSLKQEIIAAGNSIASNEVRSNFDVDAYVSKNSMRGIKVYQFFNDLANNYNHQEVSRKLNEIVAKLFNKKNVLVSISGDETTNKLLKEALKNIKLPRKEYPKELIIDIKKQENTALVIPSGVSYNAIGLNSNLFNISTKENYGKLVVLSQILNFDYLWTEVRVKGGAYGCGLNINRIGDVWMSSYRDPNVKNTYDVYKNTTNYIKNLKLSNESFKSYVISASCKVGGPLSIPSLINSWDINYLTNVTIKDLTLLKKQILKTKKQDIYEFVKLFDIVLENGSYYSIGNETKINSYNFDKIIKL